MVANISRDKFIEFAQARKFGTPLNRTCLTEEEIKEIYRQRKNLKSKTKGESYGKTNSKR
tara:strand:- start:241 stop:420 length:180 start_codon:yes stop_codon:yes gene_type:complete